VAGPTQPTTQHRHKTQPPPPHPKIKYLKTTDRIRHTENSLRIASCPPTASVRDALASTTSATDIEAHLPRHRSISYSSGPFQAWRSTALIRSTVRLPACEHLPPPTGGSSARYTDGVKHLVRIRRLVAASATKRSSPHLRGVPFAGHRRGEWNPIDLPVRRSLGAWHQNSPTPLRSPSGCGSGRRLRSIDRWPSSRVEIFRLASRGIRTVVHYHGGGSTALTHSGSRRLASWHAYEHVADRSLRYLVVIDFLPPPFVTQRVVMRALEHAKSWFDLPNRAIPPRWHASLDWRRILQRWRPGGNATARPVPLCTDRTERDLPVVVSALDHLVVHCARAPTVVLVCR